MHNSGSGGLQILDNSFTGLLIEERGRGGSAAAISIILANALSTAPILIENAGSGGIQLAGVPGIGTAGVVAADVSGNLSVTAAGSGDLSGTLTPGVYPVASAPNTVVDGTIDYGVSNTNTLTIANTGAGGLTVNDTSSGGMSLVEYGTGPVHLQIADSSSSASIIIVNAGTGDVDLGTDTGDVNLAAAGRITLAAPTLTVAGITGVGMAGVLAVDTGGNVTVAAGLTVVIVTAALTALGAQGSMTFTNGILTAQTPAT
jgi:hypothetical protein